MLIFSTYLNKETMKEVKQFFSSQIKSICLLFAIVIGGFWTLSSCSPPCGEANYLGTVEECPVTADASILSMRPPEAEEDLISKPRHSSFQLLLAVPEPCLKDTDRRISVIFLRLWYNIEVLHKCNNTRTITKLTTGDYDGCRHETSVCVSCCRRRPCG